MAIRAKWIVVLLDDGTYYAYKGTAFSHDRFTNWHSYFVDYALIDEYDYTVYQPITAKDLRGGAGRLRFHYPETSATEAPDLNQFNHDRVVTPAWDATEVHYDEHDGCFVLEEYPLEVSPLRLIFWGPYRYRGDWAYREVPPSGYLFSAEDAAGRPWTVTLRGRDIVAGEAKAIAHGGAVDFPDLARVPMAVSRIDTAAIGLGPGPETVVLAYGAPPPPSAAQGDTGSSAYPSLWLGLVDRPGNPWLHLGDLVGRDLPLPGLGDVTLLPLHGRPEVALLGLRPDLESELWLLDLATGEVRRAERLALPPALVGYRAVHDAVRDALLIFGGEQKGAARSRVYRYDLARQETQVLPDRAPPEVARASAGVVLGRDGQRLIVYGGRRGAQVLDDAWQLDLISLAWTSLGSGADGPGALEDPVLYLDETRRRLWVGRARPEPGSLGLALWSLSLDEAIWERHEVLSPPAPPGPFAGQVRSGWPRRFIYEAEMSVPYPGELLRVALEATGPGLAVTVKDSWGQVVSRSVTGEPLQAVALPALPGERYEIQVGPGQGYDGSAVSFRVSVQPARPVLEGSFSGALHAKEIAVHRGVALVTGLHGLYSVDLSVPAAPALLDHNRLGNRLLSMAPLGPYVVAGRSSFRRGLQVVAVDSAGQLTPVDEQLSRGLPRGLAAWQDRVFVASGLLGLQVYRLRGDGDLLPEDTYDHGEPLTAVAVHAQHLYVAGTSGKVWIHRLHPDGSPETVGELSGGEMPVALSVQGDTLQVALASRPPEKVMCRVGLDCSRADIVEVYDVTDRADPWMVDAYPVGELGRPLLAVERDLLLVPSPRGFDVYRAE